ncbi:LAFE_0H15214g1_1 [Lachancea fermentati]|uniref:LAFE_0H15214g1_1 n=1 Tax=Lachancea fermentati TaxID=4955 RepID=A0A1G4MKY6_LACFM|nr:LAFE_0H15214g1_1 [Lachancea fermentati]
MSNEQIHQGYAQPQAPAQSSAYQYLPQEHWQQQQYQYNPQMYPYYAPAGGVPPGGSVSGSNSTAGGGAPGSAVAATGVNSSAAAANGQPGLGVGVGAGAGAGAGGGPGAPAGSAATELSQSGQPHQGQPAQQQAQQQQQQQQQMAGYYYYYPSAAGDQPYAYSAGAYGYYPYAASGAAPGAAAPGAPGTAADDADAKPPNYAAYLPHYSSASYAPAGYQYPGFQTKQLYGYMGTPHEELAAIGQQPQQQQQQQQQQLAAAMGLAAGAPAKRRRGPRSRDDSYAATAGGIAPDGAAAAALQPHHVHVDAVQARPRVTTTMWEDENTLCYQVETNGVSVVRRADNDMINGTKLLNVAKMTRGRRDGILKAEKIRHVVKIGSMHLKGVWIPFERALAMAQREKIVDQLFPLFVRDIQSVIQHGASSTVVPGTAGAASSALLSHVPPAASASASASASAAAAAASALYHDMSGSQPAQSVYAPYQPLDYGYSRALASSSSVSAPHVASSATPARTPASGAGMVGVGVGHVGVGVGVGVGGSGAGALEGLNSSAAVASTAASASPRQAAGPRLSQSALPTHASNASPVTPLAALSQAASAGVKDEQPHQQPAGQHDAAGGKEGAAGAENAEWREATGGD